MEVLRGLLVMFIILLKANAQFLEQPVSGIVFVPVQDQVILTCSVEEGYGVDWCLAFPNGNKAVASSSIDFVFLMQQNFSLEGVVTTRSTLSLWETETQTNNGTNITCTAKEQTNSQAEQFVGNTVVVLFYGAPPPPTDLNVTEIDLSSFNISWSLEFIEGVPVNYTLTVLNLNTTSAQPIISAELLDQHYVFETSRPCDVYSFTVTAVTAAGNSTPSQELIFTRDGSSDTCDSKTPDQTTAQSRVNSRSNDTRSSDTTTTDAEVLYYIIGTITGASVMIMIIIILMILYCCVKHKRKTKKGCINALESQLQVHYPEMEDAVDQFCEIYAQVSADVAQHPPSAIVEKEKITDGSQIEVKTSTLYAEVDIEQKVLMVDDSDKEARLNMLYARVDKSKCKKVQSTDALYAVVNMCETQSGPIAACAEDDVETNPLYSQVSRSRGSKALNSSQSKALYVDVEKNKIKQNEDCSEVQEEVNALYAQVDKSKRTNKAQFCDALYAEVNKTKTDNYNATTGVDAVYSQVNKSSTNECSNEYNNGCQDHHD